MKKILIAVIALCVVAPLVAQEMDSPPIVEASHNGVAAFLQLTDEQIAAWDVIYQVHRDAGTTGSETDENPRLLQAGIEALFEAGDPDPAALGELVIERHALGEALFEVHLVYHEDFVALLDETQARRLQFIARADDVQQIHAGRSSSSS